MFNLFGLGGNPPKITPNKEMGVSGTAIYGGYVQSNEINPALSGQNKYRTFSDIMANTSIVAAGIRYFMELVGKSEWSFDGDDQTCEFVESVLNDCATPWPRIVRKAAAYRFYGFGCQEWTAKKRADGRIGLDNIESRPQHTIWRWDTDERGTVLGVVQRSPQNGTEYYIPRGKLLYLVDDTMTDSPEGLGLMRHVVEPAQRLAEYLRLESVGFETDLRGIPVGKAPLDEIAAAVKNGQLTKEDAEALKRPMIDFIQNHIRSAKTGFLLNSSPYRDYGEQQAPSGEFKWALDLLQGSSTAFGDVNTAIERINKELAIVLGVESILTGMGSSGSHALSKDKSNAMYLRVDSCLRDITASVNSDIISVICDLNGIPEDKRPIAKTESVQFKDVEEITTALTNMAQAGAVLSPNDPAINEVRGLLGLSEAEEVSPEMMGALQPKPNTQPIEETQP